MATPVLYRAAEWGADLVVSALAGDLTGQPGLAGGAVMGSAERIGELREAAARTPGCALDEASARVALMGLETLFDRMRTKRENTVAVRSFLLERRADGEARFVNHPSLRKHPQYALCRQLMHGHPGPMISFGIPGDADAPGAFCEALQLIERADAVGSNHTTIAHPHSSTHAGLDPDQKKDAVIRRNMLRLCVGNEDAADILADLERGFGAL